jgi:CNT family concentrative nucleoside transporter
MADSAHNASTQHNVVPNLDPALDKSNEHRHAHLHHDAFAEKGRQDDIMYSVGTTGEKSMIPDADPNDDALHRRHHPERHAEHYPVEAKTPLPAEFDEENGGREVLQVDSTDPQRHTVARFYRRYRPFIHLFIWLFFTGWWIASLVLHRPGTAYPKNWIIPFLFWLAISLRLLFFHAPITIITKPMHFVWDNTGVKFAHVLPPRSRTPLGALLVIAVIIVGAMASAESEDNTRANRAISLFGLAVFIFILWATSRNRKAIQWHTVIVGQLVQFIVALFVLRTKAGYDIFSFISNLCEDLLGFANNGVIFLTDTSVPKLGWFLTGVMPPIIFFVAFVSLLYYWGILQWFIVKFATFFFWAMRVSGAEAVVAAASPFIGQGESAMLIKPFVAHLTMAELHQVMTSGFATIAGSVLVAYISLGVNGQALVSSCVMSIPASLAVSKLRFPEEEETLTAGRVVVPDDDEHRAANSLHAFANGAWLGLKIAGMNSYLYRNPLRLLTLRGHDFNDTSLYHRRGSPYWYV